MPRYCSVVNCGSSSHNSGTKKRAIFEVPKKPEKRKRWLKVLSPHLKPGKSATSCLYVCELHFAPDDIRRNITFENNDGTIDHIPVQVVRVKPKSVPSIFDDLDITGIDNNNETQDDTRPEQKSSRSSQTEVHFAPEISKKTTKESSRKLKRMAVPTVSPSSKQKISRRKLPVKRQTFTNSTKKIKNQSTREDHDDESPCDGNDVVYILDSEISDIEMPSSPEPNSVDEYYEYTTDASDVNEFTEPSKMCRMCMKKDIINAKNIFEDHLDDDVSIRSALETCIYSLEHSTDGRLSKYACVECLELLSSFYNFKMFVLSQDKVQRECIVPSDPLASEDMISGQKRNVDANNESQSTKRKKIECTSDKKQLTIGLGQVAMNSEAKTIPVLLPGTLKIYEKPISAEQDEAATNAEKNVTPSQQVAEFIIHLDNNKSSIAPKLEYIALDKALKKGIDQELSNITLAKEDRDQKLGSTVTISEDSRIFYMNIPFCMVDGFLMEHKLLKGNMRYLKCASAKCSATAEQEILKPGSFKNVVTITSCHNHKKPTPTEIKKQKIVAVVRKQLQNTKGSSIRHIYEELCNLDPTVTKLVPIGNLIEEICNL